MALWVCRGCSCRFSVGAPACPQCGSQDHYEEGAEMAKITVHNGPSSAGAHVVSGAWSDSDSPDEWPAAVEPESEASAEESSANDAGEPVTGEPGETLGGPFEPLPEAVDGEQQELVSAPDYDNWTVVQLREVLAHRELPVSGTKAELIARLRAHDEP